ncbi:hypothetical protein LCGC14_2157550, partial [marine sediment metagenome]
MSHDLSARELCERALRKIGAFPTYDTAADPEELDKALVWLDIRLAALGGKTTIFWLIPNTLSFAITADVQSYDLKTILGANFPTDGIQFPKSVWMEDSGGNRSPLTMVTRTEFEAFPDPDRSGRPEFVHIDRLGLPTLKTWPTLGTGNTGFTIKLVVQTYAKDFVGGDRLRTGLFIEGEVQAVSKKKAGPRMSKILRVNGKSYDEWPDVIPFLDQIVVDPHPHMPLETMDGPMEMRVLDLICPVGKGQRGLIVAPPRSGKTVLLQQIANAILANCPEVHVIVLLVDERPEEVTDFKRNVAGEIIYSNNDQEVSNHTRISEFTLERAKRMAEFNQDVVILLDSLTRLGRAYNRSVDGSGRTMTGGVDIRALEKPKRQFGAARKIEDGGSLTILATCLVDTGSRMDEV